jgi:hypothetical protein
VLSPQGTGLVWLATESDTTLPGAVILPNPNFSTRRSSLVQVTNLGINVKDSPQSTLVFVTRLDTGAPVPEARVSIVDASSQTRWRGTSDRDGVALAPPLALRDPNRTYDLSFIVTAEKDGDLAYVASNSNGVQPWSWGLNYQLRESPTILRGSVFTDRGVYKEMRRASEGCPAGRHAGGDESGGRRRKLRRSHERRARAGSRSPHDHREPVEQRGVDVARAGRRVARQLQRADRTSRHLHGESESGSRLRQLSRGGVPPP